MYFDIQRFSTHDGDGIRSILFLKGCTLACPWCQNPESLSRRKSLLFDERLCLTDCNRCTTVSGGITRQDNAITINRKAIPQENLIALENICPSQALSVCGKPADSDELFEALMKDKPFYDQSGGGVTFSGGEPLLQPRLVEELTQRLQHAGVSSAIETCMHVPWKNIEQVLPYTDCWLTDLKHTDEDKFKKWTKGSLALVKDNFRRLAPVAKKLVVRVPVVPGFNDSREELQDILDFANSLENCHDVHLLPYHTLGINKYKLLDKPYYCSSKPLNKPGLLRWAQTYAANETQLSITMRG